MRLLSQASAYTCLPKDCLLQDSGAFVGPSVLLLAITGVLVSLFATDM